ncbi:MAG: outer membrane beta-barrel protein [Arenicella sp.]
MKATKALSIGMLTACLISTSVVSADDDTGFYIGFGINRLSADFEDENDTDFEDSDNAASIKVGYMFTNHIGLELGYLDLGDYVAEGDQRSNRIELDAQAYNIAVVGNWPIIDQMDIYGKAGLFNIDAESTSSIAGNTITRNSDENEFFAAVGAEFDLGQINLFTEFSAVDTDFNDLSLNIITAGIKLEL